MSPEERNFPTELRQRLDALETVAAQLAMGQLDASDATLIGVLRLVQEVSPLAKWVTE